VLLKDGRHASVPHEHVGVETDLRGGELGKLGQEGEPIPGVGQTLLHRKDGVRLNLSHNMVIV